MVDLIGIHAPQNERRITRLYVFLSSDEIGDGIVSTILPDFGTTPMITASEKVLPHFKRAAQGLAHTAGKKIKLVTFTLAEEIEEFLP